MSSPVEAHGQRLQADGQVFGADCQLRSGGQWSAKRTLTVSGYGADGQGMVMLTVSRNEAEHEVTVKADRQTNVVLTTRR